MGLIKFFQLKKKKKEEKNILGLYYFTQIYWLLLVNSVFYLFCFVLLACFIETLLQCLYFSERFYICIQMLLHPLCWALMAGSEL